MALGIAQPADVSAGALPYGSRFMVWRCPFAPSEAPVHLWSECVGLDLPPQRSLSLWRSPKIFPALGQERLHLMVQAKQIAYHDRDAMLADPAFADVPVERLISKDYARKRRRLINPARALIASI